MYTLTALPPPHTEHHIYAVFRVVHISLDSQNWIVPLHHVGTLKKILSQFGGSFLAVRHVNSILCPSSPPPPATCWFFIPTQVTKAQLELNWGLSNNYIVTLLSLSNVVDFQ